MKWRIAVVGPGDVTPGSVEYEAAEELGGALARRNLIVLCGGGAGVMEAVAKGCGAAGLVIGLLPDADMRIANEYLTVALRTGVGEFRNALIVTAADAVISVGGSWGTLSEIAFAVRIGRPVLSLHGWRVIMNDVDMPGVSHFRSVKSTISALDEILGVRNE